MIESLKSAAAINATAEPQTSEAATLSAAIQRLISERDTHKARAGTQEIELTRLRAVNDELRRQHEQIAAARDHYMRLAAERLAMLKHIDGTIHDLVHKAVGANSGIGESVDATAYVARAAPVAEGRCQRSCGASKLT